MDPEYTLPALTEDLQLNIDELTTALSPLLQPLSQTTSTLPLLDRAKLHVLLAYAIESLLFSSLQLSGNNAKELPVFAELARLKGYFAKIQQVEDVTSGAQQRIKVDVEGARRVIKHGLSGNDRYDKERRERERIERARAAEKARALVNKKFDENGNDSRHGSAMRKRAAEDVAGDESENENRGDGDGNGLLDVLEGALQTDVVTTGHSSSARPTTETPTKPPDAKRRKKKRAGKNLPLSSG